MSHLRYDITTHDWVIFAPERARRPHGPYQPGNGFDAKQKCPFCPGNEGDGRDEILRVQDAENQDAWSVRVVANKFPALRGNVSVEIIEQGRHFQRMEGYGAHEVIIESPDHDGSLSDYPVRQIEDIVRAVKTRYRALMEDGSLRAIIVFKNHGAGAGTSLHHPHWQIIATPVVPRLLRETHAIALDYFDRHFKCLHQVLRDEEWTAGDRMVSFNRGYVAVCPYASHLAYQIRILPRQNQTCFSEITEKDVSDLSALLKDVLLRLKNLLGDPAYNLTFLTPPRGDENEVYFLWHIDILPRLATPAGFELGSGMAINPQLPEEAARQLREALPPLRT